MSTANAASRTSAECSIRITVDDHVINVFCGQSRDVHAADPVLLGDWQRLGNSVAATIVETIAEHQRGNLHESWYER